MPYTYLIGWSNLNKWYYGVRYAKNCDPSELWVTYFTSSKYVKEYRQEFGEPDIIEIRKIFINSEKARNWESTVLNKLNVLYEEKWLNKTNNKAIINTKEHYEKISKINSRPKSEKTKLNLSIARKKLLSTGYKPNNPALCEKVRLKMSETRKKKKLAVGKNNGMFGRKHTIETKKLMSEKAKKRKNKNNFEYERQQ